MTPLTQDQEEEAKQRCRDIFYNALPYRMELAVRALGGPELLDMVRGGHSLLSVLYNAPPHRDRVMIFPLRTYEILRGLRHDTDPSCRDQQTEAQ